MNNIILCGFSNDCETDKLIKSLELEEIYTKVLISSDDSMFIDSSNCFILRHSELYDSEMYSCDDYNFSASNYLVPYYTILLRCMSRWDESVNNIDDKLFIIDSLFNKFCNLIQENSIKSIVYGTGSPHHFYNLILSYAAKYNNIDNLFPVTNWVTNRVRFVINDYNFTVPVIGLGTDVDKMKQYLEDLRNADKIISYDSKRIYSDKSTSIYPYFIFKVLLIKVLGRIKFILNNGKDLYINEDGSPIPRFFAYLRRTIFSQYFKFRYQHYYRLNSSNDIPNNAIIFYAQNQPEATSHPDGGYYPDLRYWYYVFKKFNKSLYYKEHKANFIYHQDNSITDTYHHRSIKYLNFFINKKVGILSEEFDTSTLFRNNNNVFTFTGTIILESLVKGKTVYYSGIPYHGDLPGTEVVYEDANAVLKKSNSISLEDISAYFIEQDKYSFPNYSGFSTNVKVDIDFHEYAGFLNRVILWSISRIK
jgi:hypothetical protein